MSFNSDDLSQTYTVGQEIKTLTLPSATAEDGKGMLTYTLTEDSTPGTTFASLPGLTFDPKTRTLDGTPTTKTDEAVTLIYTAIDNTTVMDSLTFTVEIVPETNTDTNTNTRLNEQILTRASQAMTASTMAAVAARVDAAAGGVGAGVATTGAGATPTVAFQLGGQSSLRGLLETHGKAMLEESMDYQGLLEGASFVLPLAAADGDSTGTPGALAFWGGFDSRTLAGDEDTLDWEGKVSVFHLGIDRQFSEKLMAGVALSSNQSSFDYKDTAAAAANTAITASTFIRILAGIQAMR